MRKHLSLIALRLIIAYAMIPIIPRVHVQWGHQLRTDDQNAFGFIPVCFSFSLVVTFLYFLIASSLHFFHRQRSWLAIFGIDSFLGACFIGLLSYEGAKVTHFKEDLKHSKGTSSPLSLALAMPASKGQRSAEVFRIKSHIGLAPNSATHHATSISK